MKKRRLLAPFAGLVALLVASSAAGQSTTLVQKSNLAHQGSFKVPTLSGNGLSYGGAAIAYNPANDSLFIVGHEYDQQTAELKIPGLGGTATVLQPLRDALGGKLGNIGSGTRHIGGQLVHNGRLVVSAFLYYDGDGSQSVSHFSRSLSLSSGSVTGPVRVGSMGAGFYSGYMGHIPSEWQSKLGGEALTGNCCLSIISRTSYGPAAFAFDPDTLSGAQPLVYYTADHQTLGEYGASGKHPQFNGTTRITGIVFPQGTASVLFFGLTGVGNYCYGEGAQCGDPGNAYKGEHAYPYRGYVWAYNANDLAAVRSGSRQPWSVTPYATWELDSLGNLSPGAVAGAAYDPATSRVFVSVRNRDGDKPVIHVFKVTNSVAEKVPSPPGALVVH